MRRNADAQGKRIRAQSQATDALNANPDFPGHSFYQFPSDAANKDRALRIMSSQSRVDVEIALNAGGKSKRSAVNGFFLEDFEQLLSRRWRLHINRMY